MGDLIELNNERWTKAFDHNAGDLEVHVSSHGRIKFRFHDDTKYVLSMTPDYKKYMAKLTLDQAVKTIRNRIDQFGVAETDIRRQEGNRIQVQLPGLHDPERAIAVIGKTAHLEFKIVDDTVDPASIQSGLVGPGREIVMMKQRAAKVPACILQASQCSLPELVQLTRRIRGLREQLAA